MLYDKTSYMSEMLLRWQSVLIICRLHTAVFVTGVCAWGEFVWILPKPLDAPHWIWEELLSGHMQVTATWGCLGNHSGTWRCPGNR